MAMSIEIDELEALLLFVKSNLTHNPAQGYTEAHYVQTVRLLLEFNRRMMFGKLSI